MNLKKRINIFLKLILIVVILCSNFHSINYVYASDFNFYNHNTKSNVKYSGKQVSYFYNNKKVDLSYPGIILSGTAFADYKELFVDELGLSASLNDKQLQISDGKTEILFTIGSRYVKINGKSQKISTAPVKLEFHNGDIKYYVPTRLIAETFGFNYYWDSNNNQVKITKTFRLNINEKIVLYNDSLYSVWYNQQEISTNMPIINYKETVYAPAKVLFEALGCTYSEEDKVFITKDHITLQPEKDSLWMSVNDIPFKMNAAPISVSEANSFSETLYVPLEFCLNLLGYKVNYNENSCSFEVQQTEYTGIPECHPDLMQYYQVNRIPLAPEPIDTYFLWASEEISDLEGIKNLTKVKAYSIENADVLELYGITREDVNDFIDNRVLVLELDSVISNLNTQFYADFNAPHLYYVLLTTVNSNSKLFIMTPLEDILEFEETEECLRIYFMPEELSLDDLIAYEEKPVEITITPTEEPYPENHMIIPVPEGFDTTSIQLQDNYLDHNLQIILPGNLSKYFEQNPIINPYEFIEDFKIVYDEETNQTIINGYTTEIYGYIENCHDKYFAVYMDKPSEIYDKIVVLDAGHGGKDPGAVRNNIYEKNITLDIINYTENLFKNTDIKVYCTRTKDKFLSLQERTKFVKEVDADIFVSLHINASELESAYGTEVYYSKANNKSTAYGLTSAKLAKALVNNLYVSMDTRLRGVLHNDYYVVQYNSVPAVLIELGFISNPEERKKLVDDNYQQKAAKAIYESIIEIFCAYPTGR